MIRLEAAAASHRVREVTVPIKGTFRLQLGIYKDLLELVLLTSLSIYDIFFVQSN